jgi:hypothetical protein
VAGSYSDHFVPEERFLLRSHDDFATWDRLTPRPNLLELIVSPERSTTLYGLTCGHLYKSLDAGTTWAPAGRGLPRHLCAAGWGPRLALDPGEPRRMYLGTAEKGVYVSSDGGDTFAPMNRGLETGVATVLVVAPSAPTRLYAGVARRGVFEWNADRRRWLPLSRVGLPVADFEGLVTLDPRHPSSLYAGTTHQGAFRLDLDEEGGQ